MQNLIITTPEELKQIISDCLTNLNPVNSSNPEPIAPVLLFSIRELATFLCCSHVTAQKLKNSGKIRYSQFGRKIVFNSAEVLEDLSKKKKS
jgi:hypothetical protein